MDRWEKYTTKDFIAIIVQFHVNSAMKLSKTNYT